MKQPLFDKYVEQQSISSDETVSCIQEGEVSVVVQITRLTTKHPLTFETRYEIGEVIDGELVISALKKIRLNAN